MSAPLPCRRYNCADGMRPRYSCGRTQHTECICAEAQYVEHVRCEECNPPEEVAPAGWTLETAQGAVLAAAEQLVEAETRDAGWREACYLTLRSAVRRKRAVEVAHAG